jgi:DNA-binding response OmpR family regulator
MEKKMDKPRVLVVDDEPEIVGIVAYALETYIFPEIRGCEVITAYNGQQALDKFEATRPDLVVLDIEMPVMDGFEAFRRMRCIRSEVPIIFLTVKDDETDVIRGYDLGADSYITKPFKSHALALQAQAILRRCGREKESPIITNGPLQINMRTHQVTLYDRPISLDHRKYQLLLCLAQYIEQPLSWQLLLKEVWGLEDWQGDKNMVKTAIARLRKKIEPDPGDPCYIITEYGTGCYKMPKLGTE